MVFCGERRSGKTSILFQIMDGRLGPSFIPALIDMQSMAVGNELDFLVRISEQVRTALGQEAEGIPIPSFGGDTSNSTTFQKFVCDVLEERPSKKLILLFDEYELFENKIDAGLLSPDVLNILANLMENNARLPGVHGFSTPRATPARVLEAPREVSVQADQLPGARRRPEPRPQARGRPGAIRRSSGGGDLAAGCRAALLHAGHLPECRGPAERAADDSGHQRNPVHASWTA